MGLVPEGGGPNVSLLHAPAAAPLEPGLLAAGRSRFQFPIPLEAMGQFGGGEGHTVLSDVKRSVCR